MKIQRRHVALTVVTVVVGVFLILPTLYIIPLSFDASSTLGVPSGRWTTSWYVELFTDRAWARAARNSLQVAVLTTVLATVLGTVLALAFRVKSRINSIANAVTLAPMIVPAVILGVGLYGLLVSWGLGHRAYRAGDSVRGGRGGQQPVAGRPRLREGRGVARRIARASTRQSGATACASGDRGGRVVRVRHQLG